MNLEDLKARYSSTDDFQESLLEKNKDKTPILSDVIFSTELQHANL